MLAFVANGAAFPVQAPTVAHGSNAGHGDGHRDGERRSPLRDGHRLWSRGAGGVMPPQHECGDGPAPPSRITRARARRRGGAGPRVPADPKPSPLAARRVLVVDDNRDAADMLTELRIRAGYATRVAYDGLSALSQAASFLPEAAVLDIGLPGIEARAGAESGCGCGGGRGERFCAGTWRSALRRL